MYFCATPPLPPRLFFFLSCHPPVSAVFVSACGSGDSVVEAVALPRFRRGLVLFEGGKKVAVKIHAAGIIAVDGLLRVGGGG